MKFFKKATIVLCLCLAAGSYSFYNAAAVTKKSGAGTRGGLVWAFMDKYDSYDYEHSKNKNRERFEEYIGAEYKDFSIFDKIKIFLGLKEKKIKYKAEYINKANYWEYVKTEDGKWLVTFFCDEYMFENYDDDGNLIPNQKTVDTLQEVDREIYKWLDKAQSHFSLDDGW